MAVQDDLRRLTQLDSIFLGWATYNVGATVVVWYKGRLLQANDATWLFRSISGEALLSDFNSEAKGRIGPRPKTQEPALSFKFQFPFHNPPQLPPSLLLWPRYNKNYRKD